MVKITLGGLDTTERECKFNVQVCSQNCFANSTDSDMLRVLDLFRFIDYTHVMDAEKISDQFTLVSFNPYTLQLTEPQRKDDVYNAIKTGFREWRVTTLPVLGLSVGIDYLSNSENAGVRPHEWTLTDDYLVPGMIRDDCTIDASKIEIAGGDNAPSNFRLDSLVASDFNNYMFYDCGNDQVCQGELTMTLNFIHRRPNENYPYLSELMPIITFCGD